MDYSIKGLKDKLLEFQPELAQKGFNLTASFDDQEKRFVVKLHKDGHEFTTFLEKQDADDCMAGKKCVNLAVQLTQFVTEFEERRSPSKPG